MSKHSGDADNVDKTVFQAWFVTPFMHPERRLDGPFELYSVCEARCLSHTDRTTAVQTLAQGRMPLYYVPRLFSVRVAATPAPIYGTYINEVAASGSRERPQLQNTLPEIVYTYSNSGLRALCQALELALPPGSADREELLIHIESELANLAKQTKQTKQAKRVKGSS